MNLRRVRWARQRGVALIVVMLLLAMAVIFAAEVMEHLESDRTRTANLLGLEQGYAYLLSAEALGMKALAADAAEDRRQGEEVDACSEEEWAVRMGPLPWHNGVFTVSVQDLQGRFNLNNLATTREGERSLDRLQVERFKRLLRLVLPADAADTADALGEEAADWTDGNTLVDGLGGAEDTEYEDRRTANTPLAEVSELRALRGATAEAWQAGDKPLFSRYITALPEGTRVNVNTAPAEVLQAMVAGLDSSRAEAVIAARDGKPFASVNDLLTMPELSGLGANEKQELQAAMGVNSEYFQVMSEVVVNGRRLRLVSDVYRPRSGGMPQVIRRDLGQAFAAPEAACNPGATSDEEGA